MAVALTGAAGYLGTQMLRRPEALEQPVLGFDLRPPRAPIATLTHRVQDIGAPMAEALRADRVETLVHLAAVLNPSHDAAEQRRVNLGGLEAVFRAAVEGEVRRLVVLSSATAYGAHPDNPPALEEDAPLRAEPAFPYAYEKRLVEERCAALAAEHPGIAVIVVRPSVILGPNADNFISRYAMRGVVPVVAGCDPPTQFVDEDDAARAIWFLVRHGPAGAYNLGAADPLPVKAIARRSGSRTLNLPRWAVRATIAVAWTLRITAITEAPPGIVPFVQFPWVVSTKKIEALGFRFTRSTGEVLERFLVARRRISAAPDRDRPKRSPAGG